MAWTAEKVRAMRESNPSNTANSSGWSAEKVRAIRTKTPTQAVQKEEEKSTLAEAVDSYQLNHSNLAQQSPAAKFGGAVNREVLLANLVRAETTPSVPNSTLGVDWNGTGAGSSLSTVEQTKRRFTDENLLARGFTQDEIDYAKTPVQGFKAAAFKDSQQDDFDELNQWFDTGDNRNLADAVRRVDSTHGAYTDTDLIRNGGWTQEQIDEARQKNAEYDAIPAWQRAARRTANTIGGIGDTVVAAPVLAVEYGKQAGKDIAETRKNWEQVEQEVQNDPRAKRLYDLLTEVDMDYQPVYPESRNRDLVLMGYGSEEIRDMRNRLAGLEVSRSIDPDESLGYQLYKRGQDLTAAAQSGLTPAARAAQGVVTSAAENLAVAAVNPAAVLPVLSAQGAAEAMGQSAEAGTGAGKALGGGLAKFAAGWGINSVGAADLAKSMGSDYAKDTVAGQIADWVRGLAGDSAFAQKYPAVANAISGGIDNAMQAFVETYADKAIDATLLGDAEAAQTLFDKDTFLTALESGLSGGASGALGGAVGTGLAKMNSGDASWAGQLDYYDKLDKAEKALNEIIRQNQRAQEPTMAAQSTQDGDSGDSPLSLASLDSSPEVGAKNVETAEAGLPSQSTPDGGDQPLSHAARDSSPTEGSPWQDGKVVQDAEGSMGQKSVGPAVEGSGSGTANLSPAQSADGGAAGSSPNRGAENRGISAKTGITTETENVKSSNVENTGETVEKTAERNGESFAPAGESYADQNLAVDTRQLDESRWARPEQKKAAYTLARQAQMSTKAAQTIVNAMPADVGAEVYANAANSLYRMGVNEVESFDKALSLTGSGSLGGATGQVLSLGDAGRTALKIAYLQGRGEAEAYNAAKVEEIGSGKGALNPDAGSYFAGDRVLSGTENPLNAFVKLGAEATGTSVHRMTEGLRNNAKGFIQTAAGKIYLSGEAGAETMMHETFHALNQWSPETGQAVMDRLMKYLVEQNGMESTDKLIRSYLGRYAESGVKITYNQALEEVTADAMQTVFGTKEDFANFVRQQAVEARMNVQARGVIGRVMNKIDEMLNAVLRDVERFLKKEPTNAAALATRNLTKEQLKDLQALYFEHQMEAGSKYRETLETKKEDTSDAGATEQAVKYSIDGDFEQAIDELDEGAAWSKRIRVGSTSEVLKSIGVKDQSIYWDSGKIRKILQKHSAENFRAGVDNSIMTKEIIKQVPQVLENPIIVLHSDTSRNADYASRIYMFGEVYDQTGKPVDVSLELLPTNRGSLEMDNIVVTSAYGKKNVQGLLNRDEILYVDPNKKRTNNWLAVNRLQLPLRITRYGSIASLHYVGRNVNTETRYQLDSDGERTDAGAADGLGDVEKQIDTVRQAVEKAGNRMVSDEGLTDIARKVLKNHRSRMDTKTLTERLKSLSGYLSTSKNVVWEDANAFVMDMAEQIMEKSSARNDALWQQYPELHQMSMKVEKGSADFEEIVYRYGSWANAKKELARHGVKITQAAEGTDTHWDADFRELQGIAGGLLPHEVPNSAAEALEAMADAYDMIRPTMENAYDENWDGVKQDIAMEIWAAYMESPELASPENTLLRKEFADQWDAVRKQAREEAQDARAKAQLAQEQKKRSDAMWAGREIVKQATAERERRDAAIERVRNAREMDNTRRAIRRVTSQLSQIVLKSKDEQRVPRAIASQVLEVTKLANETLGNQKMLTEIGSLARMIGLSSKDGDAKDRVGIEWKNSGLDGKIGDWLADVNDTRKEALDKTGADIEKARKRLDKLQELREAAEQKGDTDAVQRYAQQEEDMTGYLARLKMRQQEYEVGGMARMTAEQLRGLREILESTAKIIRDENKLLGDEARAELDDTAKQMVQELKNTKGLNFKDGFRGWMSQKGAGYKLNTMNIQRQFERMGGYRHGGAMEKMGQMLNDGQYKKTRLIVEGTSIFDNVTGPGNLKKMDRFTHELIDIGLRTDDGRAWKVTRDQIAALWYQCRNMQGLHHMTHGGLKIPNMEYAVKGDRTRAEHDTEVIRIGDLKFNEDGKALNAAGEKASEQELLWQLAGQRKELLAELSKVVNADDEMGAYTRQVIEDYRVYQEFTKKNINETSMVLDGVPKARVENYIPLRVDEDTNVVKNEGISYNISVGNESFLKARQNSGKPIYLDGIFDVVNTSLENVAQYAGMAIPLRNMQKLLSTQVKGVNLNSYIRNTWGREGEQYISKAMEDLHGKKQTAQLGDRSLAKLRSRAAQAVLTANLNVTFLQAASLPTAAAELGWKSTGRAAVQFAGNLDPVNKLLSAAGLSENRLAAIEKEIETHGDALLQYRLRGTKSGELGSMGEVKNLLTKAHDSLLDSKNGLVRGGVNFADTLAGSITKMDEITVAALWSGAKSYVQNHPAEFDAEAQTKGSNAYWDAVNRQFQRTVERTQPNYTTMQRTGMQRTGNDMMKTLMMFSTQRQQNAQIWVSAAEDYAAQLARYKAEPSQENAQAKAQAGKRLGWAISSQIVQTGTIALIGCMTKILLHRRKDLLDENGDFNRESFGKAFGLAFVESLAGNFVGGSELYTAVAVILAGTDYDTVSLTGISAVNDTVAAISDLVKELVKDTSEMDEADIAKHKAKTQGDILDVAGSLAQFYGIPFNNVKKYFEAVSEYAEDIRNGALLDFSELPASATGQYDRLYNAIQRGDAEEVQAALEKLDQMGKSGKVDSELKKRLKNYDDDILTAAEARNEGDDKARIAAAKRVLNQLYAAYGISPTAKSDAEKRDWAIEIVTGTVNSKGDDLLTGDGSSFYDGLTEALSSGRTKDVQEEIDRLRTAGKDAGSIKSKITDTVKSEYLAGSRYDREKLEKMLLGLRADGKALYEEKAFANWVKQAEKAAETPKRDPWAGLR